SDRLVVFLPVQMGLTHEQMELGSVLANFQEFAQRALFHIRALGLVGGDTEYIKIVHVVRLGRPENIQRASSVVVSLRKEVAESEEIARLTQVGLISHHRFKGSDR